MKINSFSRRTQDFIKNSGWMIFNKIYHMIFSLLIGCITARYLGPDNYGIINYGLSYVNIFNTICALGLDGVLVKRIINNPKEEAEVLGTSIFLRIVASILSTISLILFFYVTTSNVATKIVAIIQSISLIFNTYEIIELWLQAKLMSKYATIAKCIATTCVGIWKVIMLSLNVTVEFFAFSTVIESLVILIVLVISYIKVKGPKLKLKLSLSKSILKDGIHFLLSAICIMIYARMDKIMLGALVNQTAVGIYSVALTISELWQFVPMAVIDSSRPILLQYKQENEKKYNERIKLVYSLIIFMGIVVGLGIIIFGKFAIKLLFGDEYIGSYVPLCILVWATIFSVLASARTTWLITENKEKYLKIYVLLGAITNLILNYLLIKKYTAVGVAIATLITQIVVSIIAPFMFKETRISTIQIFQAMNLKDIINQIKNKKNSNVYEGKQ